MNQRLLSKVTKIKMSTFQEALKQNSDPKTMVKCICMAMSHLKSIWEGGWFYKKLAASFNLSRAQKAPSSFPQVKPAFSKDKCPGWAQKLFSTTGKPTHGSWDARVDPVNTWQQVQWMPQCQSNLPTHLPQFRSMLILAWCKLSGICIFWIIREPRLIERLRERTNFPIFTISRDAMIPVETSCKKQILGRAINWELHSSL